MSPDIAHLSKRSRAVGAFKPGSSQLHSIETWLGRVPYNKSEKNADLEAGSWLSMCRGRSYLRAQDCLHPGTGQY